MKALHDAGLVGREPDGRRVWYSIATRHADRIDALLGDATVRDAQPDLDRIAADLTVRYRGVFGAETVRAHVQDSFDRLTRTTDSPLVASRTAAFAAARLDAMRRVDAPPERPAVLFVCVQNAGRSQLAASILRQLAGDRVTVQTAGSEPASEIRQAVVTALDEIGMPVGDEFPKPLTDDVVRAADVVVTMGCGDACPVYPGRRYLDWEIEDPVGQPLEEVRRIRDDIELRVRGLLSELVSDDSPAVLEN
ncbi:hypothetical protein [Microbacterium cremeum]|uniref:arsenate reductase/protein-tyrosine-phosphatase family protein n=1 Tax=Microbacterium cremeum TaxID=2782169 RepID=UPI0030806BE4